MSQKRIRQPIVSVLAHVDHGKTTLLDYLRGSIERGVQAREAGGITQHIGATEVPIDQIKRVCGPLASQYKIDPPFSGLLFIDTPGHEAFNLLRERGGSLADIAIVVIDVNEGVKPQTVEVFEILKRHKTPFVIAANKIDRISGWVSTPGACFAETIKKQPPRVREELDTKIYTLVGEIAKHGFQSDRFDRVSDFTRQVCIIPISALTGEGVPELLAILTGLAQRYLQDKLEIDPTGPGKGSILEVKNVKGLGLTIDVILYDGMMKQGDTLLIGHPDGTIKTTIRALLKTKPLREIRMEKRFENVPEVVAASGIKISAPDLEKAIPGMPVIALRPGTPPEEYEKELQKEVESFEIDTDEEGVGVRADTIGSLEALTKSLKREGVPIRIAKIGHPAKKDIVQLSTVPEEYRVLFAFNVPVPEDVEQEAKNAGVKIIRSQVIYHLFEEYEKYLEELREKKKREVLEGLVRPARITLLRGYVFRKSNPFIGGFEINDGVLVVGSPIMRSDGRIIGRVMAIENRGERVPMAEKGQQVAVSIDKAVFGRNIRENESYYTAPSKEHYKTMVKNKELLTDHELRVLEEIREIMKKQDPLWDIGV